MITEANRHEVTMILAATLAPATKFSAICFAKGGLEHEASMSSLDELLHAYQLEVYFGFTRLATLLGYTVNRIPEETAEGDAS